MQRNSIQSKIILLIFLFFTFCAPPINLTKITLINFVINAKEALTKRKMFTIKMTRANYFRPQILCTENQLRTQ